MAKMKSCKKTKKMGYGGLVNADPISQYLSLNNNKKGFEIDNPDASLYENTLSINKAQAASNTGLTKTLDVIGTILPMLGNMAGSMYAGKANSNQTPLKGDSYYQQTGKTSFAYGGNIPKSQVEVEGEEIVQTPHGDIFEILGAKHEQGGVDAKLPVGSDVFSDRIKVDNTTLAERKKKRTKKETTLTKMLEDYSNDILIQNSLNRIKEVNSKEENQDKQVQTLVNFFKESKGEKLAYGTSDLDEEDPLSLMKNYSSLDVANALRENNPYLSNRSIDYPIDTQDLQNKNSFDFTKIGEFLKNNQDKLPVMGDAIGIGGNIFQALAPYRNTINNRATDTPNINAFKDFGKDALATIDSSKNYIDQIRNTKKKELALNANAAINRNRNSARGVNTMRALDLATNAQTNMASNNIEDSFANAMMGILGQQSQAQNVRDQIIMGGEQSRDLADRQDKGAYATQISRDLAAMGEAASRTGKHMNEIKTRKVTENLVNQISEYLGVSFNTGAITTKDGNFDFTSGKNLTHRKFINPTTEKPFTKTEWDKLSKEEQEIYLLNLSDLETIIGG
jgi:hypothetical protein